MSIQVAAQATKLTTLPDSHGALQRCSNGVECEECRKKREGTLQRAAVNAAPAPFAPPIVHDVLSSPGQPLDAGTRAFMEPRFGHDFSGVRVHTDGRAAESARSVNALAYTVGRNVVFGIGQYTPGTSEGRRLLAHELTHVIQQGGRDLTSSFQDLQINTSHEEDADIMGDTIAHKQAKPDVLQFQQSPLGISRKTKGEEMSERAEVWLETEVKTKTEVDVLHSALREVKTGKSVKFNQRSGIDRIDALAKILSLDPKIVNQLKQDWNWLVEHHKEHGQKGYAAKERAFFGMLRSPLAQIKSRFPKSQSHYWLKNTPPQVAELLYQVATPDLPVDQLYVYAAKEGLIDYIRVRIGLSPGQEPSKAQLTSVNTTASIDAFEHLGADHFMTEMQAGSLDKFLPSSFDRSLVHEVVHQNENVTDVHSAEFTNMLAALQGFAAMVRRRRSLFLRDAQAFGYAAPTIEEIIYWTYIYYNTGEFGGKAQLQKFQKMRHLGDWITKGEYPHAMVVLQSYQMLTAMGNKQKIF